MGTLNEVQGTRIVAGKLRAVAGIKISDFDSIAYLQEHAVTGAKQHIDDIKIEIYMEAQKNLKEGKNVYICTAIQTYIIEDYSTFNSRDSVIQYPFINMYEMFSEFIKLFDGYKYYPANVEEYRQPIYSMGDPWFYCGWIEPRIRLINYLLHV